MVDIRHLIGLLVCFVAGLAVLDAQAQAEEEVLDGPAYAKYKLTLTPGWREEAAGPFYYHRVAEGQEQWGIPPFFCRTITPDVEWSEWEFMYPAIDYRRFGKEYRLELGQFLSFSGGQTPEDNSVSHETLFPFYFHQHSTDTNHDYTAVFPFYGHLENRMFRSDIKFVMFPFYSETRKKDVVTDNYLYPIFDRRRGNGLTGWEVWPFAGEDRKIPTFRTNNMDEVETIGGYDKRFILWPFYFKNNADLGTTNPASSLTMIPFYSKTRSPSRDETSYGFPLGFNAIHDHEKHYDEYDFLWPLFVQAHHGTNRSVDGTNRFVERYFPFYSHSQDNGMGSIFYGFLLYKINHLESPPLDRLRRRVLYCLYSDTVEKNTETKEFSRHVEAWPLFTYRREMAGEGEGNEEWQALAFLEPLFPNNRTILREYSPLWALWRAEKNPRTHAASQSLLWNLYRHESVGQVKKTSLFFGLFQYHSTPEGGRWRFCHFNLGGKAARAATAAKS
jgi:hypothetical protein